MGAGMIGGMVGNAIGGPVGRFIGSAVGSGLGQVVTNQLQGRRWDEGLLFNVGLSVATEGVMMGAERWARGGGPLRPGDGPGAQLIPIEDEWDLLLRNAGDPGVPDWQLGNPRRRGLPIREDAGWVKGQLTDVEYNALRDKAMRRGERIVMSGSLTETDLGFRNRYDPNYTFPEGAEWRATKPHSELAEIGVGDIDLWEGSNLTPGEITEIEGFFPEGFRYDPGYTLRKYPNLETFGPRGYGAGAIVFEPDGSTWRIPAAWQVGKFAPIPGDWVGRVAENRRGIVYQRPGAKGNADSIRFMGPTERYPQGYARYYNSLGQPLDVYGKPGDRAATHIHLDYRGPIPGWKR